MTVSIRRADPADLVDVMRLFDGALLDTEFDRIEHYLTSDSEFLLVACTDGRPVGALAVGPAGETSEEVVWPDSAYISAIAVQKQRRAQGVGRALIEAAARRTAPRALSATFDERVRPFYMACGFEIEEREGRLWGRRDMCDTG